MDIEKIVEQMTLQEKASLLSGSTFWQTDSLERFGINAITMSDGPHGLRMQDKASDHLGLYKSKPSTCFPTSQAMACSFDPELAKRQAEAIAREANSLGVNVVLGPGMNIKRSPLCGRNFEYYSEDPYLTGVMAAETVKGLQENGVAACPKHFAVNNQENERMTLSCELDERTLREIYLSAFEYVVKNAAPQSLMSSYNRIGGVYSSDNKKLLTDILRNEWGFDGMTVTDWGGLSKRVEAVKAGTELEMPTSGSLNTDKVINAVNSGELSMADLDKAVSRILSLMLKHQEKRNQEIDYEAHHALAKEIARDCMVLLKNEDNCLPLKDGERVLCVGDFARATRFQGGGSSHVNAYKTQGILESVQKLIPNVEFAESAQQALEKAPSADKVVIFAGLHDHEEMEGLDREHINLSTEQLELISTLCKVHSKVVVCIVAGGVVRLTDIKEQASSILLVGLAGQGVGEAVADVLTGYSPGGRLAETYPLELEHCPSYLWYRPFRDKVHYSEGIYVGYRYFLSKKLPVAYPFGYGLTYSSFAYSDIKFDGLNISLTLTNTGAYDAADVVQVYIGKANNTGVPYPQKQLKAFKKVALKSGESKNIELDLKEEDFCYYDSDLMEYNIEPDSEFVIYLCRNAEDVIASSNVTLKGWKKYTRAFHPNSMVGEFMVYPQLAEALKPVVAGFSQALGGNSDSPAQRKMAEKMIFNLPLRGLVQFTQGAFSEEMMAKLIESSNALLYNHQI